MGSADPAVTKIKGSDSGVSCKKTEYMLVVALFLKLLRFGLKVLAGKLF